MDLNREEADDMFSLEAAKEARLRASSATQVSCICCHHVNADITKASYNDHNTFATGSDSSRFHSAPPASHEPLDDEAYTSLREKVRSVERAAFVRSGYGPWWEEHRLRLRVSSFIRPLHCYWHSTDAQATATSSSSPTLTIPTSTSYSTSSSTTQNSISTAERMMLGSYFTALQPLLHDFRRQLLEDTRREENMFVGSFEYLPLLLLFSAVFLFGFSIRGMVKAVRRWGLRRWGLRRWGLRRWGLRRWGLRRWGLRRWGLRRWGLRRWGLRLLGSSTTGMVSTSASGRSAASEPSAISSHDAGS
ncbi:hypothetical protein JI435_434840 [Parastagonospora nodorum SN15]|uniref:Uncharacterized protein n=1 Tax=Phaeosphaeria nodorum (strain SN15 / ATCC MYA-4574 / FGSC 10173) TaxID=321614 RepID=A0A7U2F283_PHANO|nr:hypothetical protein JI435_434840 [Parastagonospora nodorum SN15]